MQGLHVNVAVGYGGRREIADAVRALLHEQAAKGTTIEDLANVLDVEHIAEHLYTKGQPDPDLVIRTSGEQRLSGFLLWQSAHSEFYFCEAYWPDFRKVDFLRAIRVLHRAAPPLRRLSRAGSLAARLRRSGSDTWPRSGSSAGIGGSDTWTARLPRVSADRIPEVPSSGTAQVSNAPKLPEPRARGGFGRSDT